LEEVDYLSNFGKRVSENEVLLVKIASNGCKQAVHLGRGGNNSFITVLVQQVFYSKERWGHSSSTKQPSIEIT
jgi:hypothetical protein